MNHVTAMAVGGLVIWIPTVARPDEMRGLLRIIIPTGDIESDNRIVDATQIVGFCLVPISTLAFVVRVCASPRDLGMRSAGLFAVGELAASGSERFGLRRSQRLLGLAIRAD